MRRHGFARDALIETLHTVQESFGCLDKLSPKFVAESLRVAFSHAYGMATFYHFFTLKPPGAHTCLMCMGTACYIKSAGNLLLMRIPIQTEILRVGPGSFLLG